MNQENVQTSSLIDGGCGRIDARFRSVPLTSAFQPIFSFAHPGPVGYEALARVRANDGCLTGPVALFDKVADDEAELVRLDRLCRSVHLRNFCKQESGNSWVFLNVRPEVVLNGQRFSSFFARLLADTGIAPHRVVVEIVENAIDDETALAEAIRVYKDMGCLVAIDDFGVGHSNFNRIWRVAPDIVKLDRSLAAEAPNNPVLHRTLPGLVSVLHEAGCLVLMEGIETEEQALIAMEADADLLQGFLFGLPSPDLLGYVSLAPSRLIWDYSGQAIADPSARQRLSGFIHLFRDVCAAMVAGETMRDACFRLIRRSEVERCYLLDEMGGQAEPNLVGGRAEQRYDPRFEPLKNPMGANWYRRPYFQQAMAEPRRVQVSRPYLSLTGANLVVTLSVGLRTDEGFRVFCCDLDWSEITCKVA